MIDSTPADDRWLAALRWHRLLQESSATELTPARIHAWREWIAEDRNRQVFDQLCQLLEDGPLLRQCNLLCRDDAEKDAPDAAESVRPGGQPRAIPEVIRSWLRTLRVFRGPKFAMLTMAVLIALAAILLAPVKASYPWQTSEQSAHAQIHETGSGQVRNILLEDGSSVLLGAQSSIVVQFSTVQRLVRLDRGEAWFKVAHAPSRPFVVSAGPRTITAIGTAFVVERDTDRVVVTVTDGAVQVASTTEFSTVHGAFTRVHPQVARVSRGEKMSYADGGFATPVEHQDPASATGWSEGRFEFDHVPLWRVAEVVNRYSHRAIALDPALGEQIFTGLVLQEQIDNWICGLEDIFPVQIVEEGERVLVRPRVPGMRPALLCNASQ